MTSVASVEAAARVSRSERPRTGDETPELRGGEHALARECVLATQGGAVELSALHRGRLARAYAPLPVSRLTTRCISLIAARNSAGAGKSRGVSSVNGDRV